MAPKSSNTKKFKELKTWYESEIEQQSLDVNTPGKVIEDKLSVSQLKQQREFKIDFEAKMEKKIKYAFKSFE